MAHHEPPHQDLRCLQTQLFSSLVVKELMWDNQNHLHLEDIATDQEKFNILIVLSWIIIGQGPAMLAVSVGRVIWKIFLLSLW